LGEFGLGHPRLAPRHADEVSGVGLGRRARSISVPVYELREGQGHSMRAMSCSMTSSAAVAIS
jgi:hypothetical protein